MKARHKSSGGAVKPTGGPGIRSEIAEGLMARKRGGRVESDGEKKHLEKVHGEKAAHRLDRPGRKRGGRVGADSGPLSSAGKGDHPHSACDEMSSGGGVKKSISEGR